MKGAAEPILEGQLFEDIAKDDSSWTIGKTPLLPKLTPDNGVLTFELEKYSCVPTLRAARLTPQRTH